MKTVIQKGKDNAWINVTLIDIQNDNVVLHFKNNLGVEIFPLKDLMMVY